MTQIIARDVAAGVEFARSLGFRLPADFDIGVRFIDDGARTRIRMRLNDATYDSIVKLPDLDGNQPLRVIATMWEVAWQRIHADALTVVIVWIDKHPDDSLDAQQNAACALPILDALLDEDLYAKWMAGCRERSRHFKYTTLRER
jgi:hypothetical protein